MLGDVVWIVLPFAICGGMLWLANRIEPHWTSKDGRRFLTTAQTVDRHGRTLERRREVRVTIAPDGTLNLSRRGVLKRNRRQRFEVVGKSAQPPRGKEVFLLEALPPAPGEIGDFDDPTDPTGGTVDMLLLRLPAKSASVTALDAVLARPG